MAINAAIIHDGRILLVRKKQIWILPGGKPEPNESDFDSLRREVREELSGTELENFRFYREFEGITPHKQDLLKARVYFADISGQLGRPSGEIDDSDWIAHLGEQSLSNITSKIVDSLARDGYLRR
ncbi:MAG TPA: NUDIX domain-containing protein [Candidatus Norongarragalinales archaeon]|nr:NUDIX domain-containing protein [Candidatus Norongarragalinales archaeon]